MLPDFLKKRIADADTNLGAKDYPDQVASQRKKMAEGKLCAACGAKMPMKAKMQMAYNAQGELVVLEGKTS